MINHMNFCMTGILVTKGRQVIRGTIFDTYAGRNGNDVFPERCSERFQASGGLWLFQKQMLSDYLRKTDMRCLCLTNRIQSSFFLMKNLNRIQPWPYLSDTRNRNNLGISSHKSFRQSQAKLRQQHFYNPCLDTSMSRDESIIIGRTYEERKHCASVYKKDYIKFLI